MVALRPWASADAETVFRICQDSQIQLWTAVPVPYELIHAQSYVDDAAPNAGYTFEGVLRSRLTLRERRIDVAVYSMLPGDPTAP